MKKWFKGIFYSLVLSMKKTFSKSYLIPPLEFTLDYIVLNCCSQDTTCFTNAANVPCPIVKSVILNLFKPKPKFCNFLLDQNFFFHKMPKKTWTYSWTKTRGHHFKKRKIFKLRNFFPMARQNSHDYSGLYC